MPDRRQSGDGVVFVAFSGSSMMPALRGPAMLEVAPYGDRAPRAGDVVFYGVPGRAQGVVHRILLVTPSGIQTRGDNRPSADPWLVSPGDLVGRVVAVWYGDNRHEIAGGPWGRLGRLWLPLCRSIGWTAVRSLSPVFRALTRSGDVASVVPGRFRPRVVAFNLAGKRCLRLMVGSQVVGHFDPVLGRWQIRGLHRLWIDERRLPASNGHAD